MPHKEYRRLAEQRRRVADDTEREADIVMQKLLEQEDSLQVTAKGNKKTRSRNKNKRRATVEPHHLPCESSHDPAVEPTISPPVFKHEQCESHDIRSRSRASTDAGSEQTDISRGTTVDSLVAPTHVPQQGYAEFNAASQQERRSASPTTPHGAGSESGARGPSAGSP